MSVALAITDVLRWTGGTLRAGDAARICTGVGIDSRRVAPGQLFVAIRGPRHDAHGFLESAAAAGAAGVLVARDAAIPDGVRARCAVVAVEDTTAALGALAAGYRGSWDGPVVVITGSNGKTTTKEMCAAILSVRAPCLKTEGNLNNHYGLPLTMLRREATHRAAVLEIGMNHAGEIAPLAAIARPTVGLITNVGTAHVENLGSQEAIAAEKGALFEALPEGAVAVANADDPRVVAQLARSKARPLLFGRGAGADVRAEQVVALGGRGCAFELVAPQGRTAVRVAGVGQIPVVNALAAAAAALAAGATLGEVAAGLEDYRPPHGRLEPVALPRNVILLNDTYNANPQSMEVALRSLAELKGASRGIAVVGDMGELGETAPAAHRATGRLAAALGLDFVFALGRHAGEVVAGAVEGGLARERAVEGADHADLAARVAAVLRGSDWVLVKGSRSMQMERVVEALSQAGAER
ncbi:MAG: UDP-N-acetylmuramoyl-tripeptide--D-alanyl-D-alanine ligase [Proteobacteria bacterium]|nr:MAG: UDP-N-acetylmuramoyl-tripeptide--D-alanyl-D-alanine ligase [Pseudomonadota bacterium]